MNKILTFFLLCSTGLVANELSRQEYLKLMQRQPEVVKPLGNATKGEIEILLDPIKMASIEKATGRDVGVLKSDAHWIWLNDACKFPNGQEGVIGRILAKNLQRYSGSAVLPILPNGKAVLNCEFRHSTRHWELEMPRGGIKPGESLEMAARREVLEETGMVVNQLVHLGEVNTDSGVTGMVLTIFMSEVSDEKKPERESSEAINQTLKLSIAEIEEAFVKGYVECLIKGEMQRVNVRDPFLAYAISMIKFKIKSDDKL
jgi:ADP-ribose pyrophosphatase